MNELTIHEKLKSLPSWTHDKTTNSLVRTFEFKSYLKTISFVNAVAWIANKENHHPDLFVQFNRCRVSFTTHDQQSVTEQDFKLCQLIEEL